MKNDLVNRERRAYNYAKRLKLAVTKGKKENVTVKIKGKKESGYMINDDKFRIIAGWINDGIYQLSIDQVEAFLSMYEHFYELINIDFSVFGIENLIEDENQNMEV